MTTYAIGDIQGCYDELMRLLERVRFDPAADRLWLTGDLVNRGPRSLETLRFVKSLGERAVTVLGNHDLHLVATAAEPGGASDEDTLRPVLEAPDRDALITWLRTRPLLHRDVTLGFTLVHAGLPPQWDLTEAAARAREVEAVLAGDQWMELMRHMYGNEPSRWDPALTGWDRLRFIINCFTRMRYCDGDGRLDLKAKGAPSTQGPDRLPWFRAPGRASAGERIIFGHWSTLGPWAGDGVYCIDTGCLWGRALTALALAEEPGHEPQWHTIACPEAMTPADAW